MFLSGFLIVLVLVLVYLLIIIFFPILREPQVKSKKQAEERVAPENREEIVYEVEGEKVRGWLYLPEERKRLVPCIILSHGFGGTKDTLLERYALRFNEAGYAALTYDYRHFGTSEGVPRQLFMASKQEEDLRGAVDYARNRKEIDCKQIVLWGTSAGGGYGLVLAAENPTIAGIIAQCPALDKDIDGRVALEREGWRFFLKLFVHAQRDRGRGRLGLSPHYIPIVGRPGETAMLTAPGAYEGYQDILLNSPTFQNRVCAQVLLTGQGENPSIFAAHVHCPTLILACEKDILVSMEAVEKVKKSMGDYCRVKTYPIDHFDIYQGEDFDNAVQDMLEFLAEIL
jgi:pimeloyl-ACP methyl ester carboxylesterase